MFRTLNRAKWRKVSYEPVRLWMSKQITAIVLVLLLGSAILVTGCKQGATIEPEPQEEPEIMGRLMTDDEMVNLVDPDAPDVRPEWEAWIKENAVPIRSLTYAGDFSDLQFLKNVLAGRSIVQLGESGHGVKEFNTVKVRLVKFLHEEMGYDVIAFESCIFTCFHADQDTGSTADDMLKGSIYGVWITEEVLELFEYIKETRKTSNPLVLTGFDMKSSSYEISTHRPRFLRDIIKVIDPVYAEEVYKYDSEVTQFLYAQSSEINEPEKNQYFIDNQGALRAYYKKLLKFIDDNMDALLEAFPTNRRSVWVARQTVWSFIENVDFRIAYINKSPRATFFRDRAMAENLACLAEKIHPGKKIMVWAHNFHIRHRQIDLSLTKTMGHWLVDRFRPQLYTIGLYAYRGKMANNSRQVYSVVSHKADSLEAIGYRARLKIFFVDILFRDREPGNSWMFMEIPAKDSGIHDYPIISRDQYDGIIYVDTVHPPDYIRYW